MIYSLSQIPYLIILRKGDAEQSWKIQKFKRYIVQPLRPLRKQRVVYYFLLKSIRFQHHHDSKLHQTMWKWQVSSWNLEIVSQASEIPKGKVIRDWYKIIQVFTSAYKTSTGASQCCALRDLIWKYINFVGERKKLTETLDSKLS